MSQRGSRSKCQKCGKRIEGRRLGVKFAQVDSKDLIDGKVRKGVKANYKTIHKACRPGTRVEGTTDTK